MSTANAAQLVHESETQRQHVRVPVPGTLEIAGHKGKKAFRLHDLSGGGLAFEDGGIGFRPGHRFSGCIQLALESVTIAVPVRFEVRHVDTSGGRVGARFDGLDATSVATLRRVVSAYVGGELIGAGELIHTVSRNNFTAPRPAADGAATPVARGVLARIGATLRLALIASVGASALVYTAQRVGQRVFGTHSLAARVSGPSFRVEMPRDGMFHSLVPADGVVKKGSPIGTFETSMLGLVESQALEASLSRSELAALLSQNIKGTVTSPCDCRVTALYAADGQYVGKGQHIADLAPEEFAPYVVARFSYRDAQNLRPGTPVSLRVNGDPIARDAHVAQLRQLGDADNLSQDMLVVVQTARPLSMDLVSRPAEVSATGTWFGGAGGSRLDRIGTAQAAAEDGATP